MTHRHPSHREAPLRRLLADAALFNLLARAFTYPRPGHHATVSDAFRRIGAARGRRGAVSRALAAAARAWPAADPSALPAEYIRLFLGSGPCPLHETAYGDGRRIAGRPVELADVQGFYQAFGFAQSERNPDLPDHLCAELEFYSLLLIKQAYALDADWTARHDIARRAATAFLNDHLGRWVPAFTEQLAEHGAAEPYRALAALLAAAVAEQCRRRGIAPQLASGRLPHDFMQDDDLVCPRATGPDPSQ
jgi:DMSO reductase family type II enzyme chaperone